MTIRSPRVFAVLVAVVAMVLTLIPSGTSQAKGASIPYLALGDSLPYGWDIVTQPITSSPSSHVGYPETLAARSPLEVTNAACPGETSASFLDRDAPSLCSDGLISPPGPGLKVDWGDGSQLAFAVDFLQQNTDTGLVSLQLGANDLFLCQRGVTGDGVPGCSETEFIGVLQQTGANIGAALAAIRTLGGYDGPIVLVGYYSLDYGDPEQFGIAAASRSLLQDVAGSGLFGDVVVADGFAAFEKATRRADGDPCAAGLLLPEGDGGCDIHTTPRGDRVMAQAVRRAIDLGEIVSSNRSGR